MANYTRRAQNDTSRFLREGNLNAVYAADPHDDFSMAESDLDMFMNKDFIDFDTGLSMDFKEGSPADVKPGEPAAAATVVDDFSMEYMNTAGDFNFDYGTTFASPLNSTYPDSLQPMQPATHGAYPPISHAHAFGPHAAGQPKTGDKRRSTEPQQAAPVHNRALSIEEASRVAAEEDKRRRNTAASARFRIKKKQREAALEKSAKEMNDKVSALETKLSQLETENQWLKKLILEKNNGSSADEENEKAAKANSTKDKDEITVKKVAKKEKAS